MDTDSLVNRAKLILVKQAMIKQGIGIPGAGVSRSINWAIGRGYRPLIPAAAMGLAGTVYGAATGKEGDRLGNAVRYGLGGATLGLSAGLASKFTNPAIQRADRRFRTPDGQRALEAVKAGEPLPPIFKDRRDQISRVREAAKRYAAPGTDSSFISNFKRMRKAKEGGGYTSRAAAGADQLGAWDKPVGNVNRIYAKMRESNPEFYQIGGTSIKPREFKNHRLDLISMSDYTHSHRSVPDVLKSRIADFYKKYPGTQQALEG